MRGRPWLWTYSGRKVSLTDCLPSDLCIHDIAHSLAQQCRWVGSTRVHYSVAQHSVHVARIVPAEHRGWGLLHDAAEAYLGDMNSLLKRKMPEYRKMHDAMLKKIGKRFGLKWPVPKTVKQADVDLRGAEARDLIAPYRTEKKKWPTTYLDTIVPWSMETAERVFLAEVLSTLPMFRGEWLRQQHGRLLTLPTKEYRNEYIGN